MKFPRLIWFLPALFLLSCADETAPAFDHPLVGASGEKYTWNWFDVDGMICRSRSQTGIGVRFGENSKKWVFYLQGGGACFTEETCAGNPSNFPGSEFLDRTSNGSYKHGLLNYQRSENPVGDWNAVFVPYCTGDVHSGNNPGSYGLGLSEPQEFVGSRNMAYLLDFLKPYMEATGVDEIMVAGVSAGGFGTHLTYYAVKQRFPQVKTHLINDSGPLISDPEVFPPCLLLGFQLIYNLPVPPGFLVCCRPTYGLADIYPYLTRLYPEDNFGLITFLEDETIRYFFAAGQNTCTGGNVSGALFRQGLEHLREVVLKPTGKISTYYRNGSGHTFIQSDDRYFEEPVSDVYLYDWVRRTMNGEVVHVAP